MKTVCIRKLLRGFICFVVVLFTPDSTWAKGPLVLAHYIPWYQTKPVSGVWGWHWTMNHFNPEQVLENGQREAASHDYPLLGLYDCSDSDVLECQVLQMKFSGIQGVIINAPASRLKKSCRGVKSNFLL